MTNPVSAAGTYAAIARLGAGGGLAKPQTALGGAQENGTGFASLVQQFVTNTADSGRKAEAMMTKAAVGKADLIDVVTAVSESEAAIETLVAVRDKVIASYEEIMRMPI
jgi:flagellar hook-basal body complex protein FliE